MVYPGAGREVKAAICLAEPDSHHIKTLHTLGSKHPGCDRTGNVPFFFHVCFLDSFHDAMAKSNPVRLAHHGDSHVGAVTILAVPQSQGRFPRQLGLIINLIYCCILEGGADVISP